MKKYPLVFLCTLLTFSFLLSSCRNDVPCQKGINLLPMYGNVTKCKNQLQLDEKFIAEMLSEYPTREEASLYMLEKSGDYVVNGQYDVAMKRANQAWLLDDQNIGVYVSFVTLLDLTGKTDEAKNMLDLTFEKLKNRKEPDIITETTPPNDAFVGLIASCVVFAYSKNKNPELIKYLYQKLDQIQVADSVSTEIKKALKDQIAEIE